MLRNEPDANLRVIPLFVVDSLGAGVAGISWSAGDLKLCKYGDAWASATNLPTEPTGGPAGSYELALAVGETNTLGPLFYSVEHAGIQTIASAVLIDYGASPFALNEANVDLRVLALFLIDSLGAGVGGITFASGDAKKIKAGDGSWSNLTNLPVEITGGVDGCYTLQLEQAELDIAGVLGYQVTTASTRDFIDAITVTNPPALYRMRAFDAGLSRMVYWNANSIDTLGAQYVGPGPLSGSVVFRRLG